MLFKSKLLLSLLSLCPTSLGFSQLKSRDTALTGLYTLTSYAPGNATLNGGKFQGRGGLLIPRIGSYCPSFVGTSCPNGTDSVFSNSLYPSSMVPGGQDLYVDVNGQIGITVQHSHSIPYGAYWSYQGWNWVALEQCSGNQCGCPVGDARYNCTKPTGYFTFKAPPPFNGSNPPGYVGGVMACPSPYDPTGTQLLAWAVTPQFNQSGCTPIVGLGTHPYSGINPPVWSY
ncbi:uncharacterized protein J3D65DRAFT_665890 [Phyllosticta citribraziliensis]|uniref:Uncharacterized protein n=1 Tax=Phyllosticta citribraziliensis TaxID=989973 RepID=A0ABR1M152_9PEZI